LVNGF